MAVATKRLQRLERGLTHLVRLRERSGSFARCGRFLGMINRKQLFWTSDSGWEGWRLRFGKYCGRSLGEIVKKDPDYLVWLSGQDYLSPLDAPRVDAAALAALTQTQSGKNAKQNAKKRESRGKRRLNEG